MGIKSEDNPHTNRMPYNKDSYLIVSCDHAIMKSTLYTTFPLKIVVCAEILSRDFIQTQRNYYLWITTAKIQRLKEIHC